MAFYDEMADVATELLTEFGKAITFERITKTFDKITGKNTLTGYVTTSTVGVEVPINNRLVDGSRIQAGDRFFVIDSSYAPAMGDRLQDSPYVPCAYPLDATLADLIALEIPNKLTASVDQQTGSYIQKSISYRGGLTVAGGPATTSPLLLDAGQKAFRFILSATPQVDAGIYSDTAMAMFAVIISPALDNLCQITMLARKNGEFELVLWLESSPVLTLTNRASGVAVCDLMFNAVTGEVTLWVDNVQQVLTSNTYTPGNAFIAIIIAEADNAAGNTGSAASIEMVTNAASITGTAFPYGTTDIDGNQIGYPEVSPSWSIVEIQPIKPASTVVAYRLQVRK